MRAIRLLWVIVLCFVPTLLTAEEPALRVTLVPATGEIIPPTLDPAKPLYRFEVAAVGRGKTVIISTHALVQTGSTENLRAGRPEGPLLVTGTIAVNPDGTATYMAALNREGAPAQTARGTVALTCSTASQPSLSRSPAPAE
jgi:hypothetical protein